MIGKQIDEDNLNRLNKQVESLLQTAKMKENFQNQNDWCLANPSRLVNELDWNDLWILSKHESLG